MTDGIRSYGPGKFNTILDSYASQVTLDGGADEEIHVGEGGGYYGLVRIDPDFIDNVREVAAASNDRLTTAERALLKGSVAVIFYERSDGIVEATWFDDMAEADDEWADIEEEHSDDGEGDDEDDEEQFDDEGDDDDEDVFSSEEMQQGYVISDARGGGVNVVHEHKHVGHYEDTDEALDAIESKMQREQFFPNIYYVNDHGNIDLLDSEGNSIKSRV